MAVAVKPGVPFQVDLSLTPAAGGVIEATARITAITNLTDAQVTLYAPRGARMVDGATPWHGAVSAGETITLVSRFTTTADVAEAEWRAVMSASVSGLAMKRIAVARLPAPRITGVAPAKRLPRRGGAEEYPSR